MFKKLITTMVAVAFFTINAQAAARDGLKKAFDELNYSLDVEWDQRDQVFYAEQVKKFYEAVSELEKAGMTEQELFSFAKSQIKNEKLANEVESALAHISASGMNPEEASQFMMENMKYAYAHGASWNGSAAMVGTGVLVVIVALVVASAIGAKRSVDEGSPCYDSYWILGAISLNCLKRL